MNRLATENQLTHSGILPKVLAHLVANKSGPDAPTNPSQIRDNESWLKST